MIQKVTFYFTPNTVRYQLAKNHSVNTVEKKREGRHLLLNEEQGGWRLWEALRWIWQKNCHRLQRIPWKFIAQSAALIRKKTKTKYHGFSFLDSYIYIHSQFILISRRRTNQKTTTSSVKHYVFCLYFPFIPSIPLDWIQVQLHCFLHTLQLVFIYY